VRGSGRRCELRPGFDEHPEDAGARARRLHDQGPLAASCEVGLARRSPVDPEPRSRAKVRCTLLACRNARHRERRFPLIHAQQVRAAILELLFEPCLDRHLRHRVRAVDPVEASLLEAPGGQERDERVVEQDVDVRGEHERRARPPDPDVLGDHLEERQCLRMSQPAVNRRGNGDDAHPAWAQVRRPRECLRERSPPRGGIPVNEDELGGEPVPAALCDPAVYENLHAPEHAAAVVVVSRRGHDGKVGLVPHELSG
jgi:hypothetical protein